MTMANGKKLDAAHNNWLRRILHISWRDKITNKAILERTGHEDMGKHHKKKNTTLDMGHVARMEGQRRAAQVMDWSPKWKRSRGRPRKTWQETTCIRDIRCMDMTWSEAI